VTRSRGPVRSARPGRGGKGFAAALLAAGIVLSGLTALRGIQPNDEGLMLQMAARIADQGQVPYRDFWLFYPPGQPLLLAGLWELFGPTLVSWRVVRVLLDALVAVLAWSLAGRLGAGPRWALAAWLAALLAMAYPSGPHPSPACLALALGALLTADRRPGVAGALAAGAGFFRLEFAAYLLAGLLLAEAVRRDRRGAARLAGAAAATGLVLFAPVVALAGLRPVWESLVEFPLSGFSSFQRLPFPLDYDGPLNLASPGGFLRDSAEPLLLFYLPLVLMIGLAASLAALALSRRRRDETPLLVATAVFSLGTAHYLLARTDLFHTGPLAVMVAVLAAAAAAAAAGPRLPVLGVLAAGALAFLVLEGADRRWLELRAGTVPLRAEVADGVRIRPQERAALEATLADLRRRVPPGEATYVATLRADRVTQGYPLLYILAGRRNPTRYDIQQPGIVTSAPVQREIVADLQRARPPAVVRFTSPATAAAEPNRSGRSSGVRILDDYLARAYAPVARHGDFLVLERR
jgi:hypothetical protein